MFAQPVDEILTQHDLFQGDIFIGPMGLFDAARPADDGGDARSTKQPGFGAETDLAGGIGAGQGFGEMGNLRLWVCIEAGKAGILRK